MISWAQLIVLRSLGYLVSRPLRPPCCLSILTSTLREGNGYQCPPRPYLCLDQKTGSVQRWWPSCLLMPTDPTIPRPLTPASSIHQAYALKSGNLLHLPQESPWSRRRPMRKSASSMTGFSTEVRLRVGKRMMKRTARKMATMRVPPDHHPLQQQASDHDWPQHRPLHCLHRLLQGAPLRCHQTTDRHLQPPVQQP